MTWTKNTRYTVTMRVGESFAIYVTVKDRDGALVDLTSAKAYLTAREAIDDADTTILKRTANAGGESGEVDILDQTTYKGQYRVNLVPADTEDLPHGATYVYDSWVVLSTGERLVTIPAAPFVLEPRVTVIP
jgi:hypothetical protein